MNKGSQLNQESGASNEQGVSAERLELSITEDISCKGTLDIQDIANEVLWNNQNIALDGNDKSSINKGILAVKDIFNEVGGPLCWSKANFELV